MEINFPQTAQNKSKLAKIVLFACLCLLANIDILDLSYSHFLSLSYDQCFHSYIVMKHDIYISTTIFGVAGWQIKKLINRFTSFKTDSAADSAFLVH